MKAKINLLVGSKVLIDWPMRWKGADPKYIEEFKKEAKRERHYGETGTILAYNHNTDSGRELEIRLDKTGDIESFHTGAVTITALPTAAEDETLKVLREIRDLISEFTRQRV